MLKPLPAVPWTTEDCNIEWRNTVRHHRQGVFGFMGTQAADRRDAALMLAAQCSPGRRLFDCYGTDLIPQWVRGLPRGWMP